MSEQLRLLRCNEGGKLSPAATDFSGCSKSGVPFGAVSETATTPAGLSSFTGLHAQTHGSDAVLGPAGAGLGLTPAVRTGNARGRQVLVVVGRRSVEAIA